MVGQTEQKIIENQRNFESTKILFDLDYIQSTAESIKSNSSINQFDSENIVQDANESRKSLHPKLANIKMTIESKALWNEFDKLGTEMIVTRSGR